jgi:ABC-type uncharacterized transport system ATPase subunit
MATYDSVSRTVPLLDVRGLHRSFYGIRALDGVDLAVEPRTIAGLIGPNGAGKTTFNRVSGLIPPEGGRVVFDGGDVTGWLPGLKPVQVAAVRELLIGASLLVVPRLRPAGLLPERIPREAAS